MYALLFTLLLNGTVLTFDDGPGLKYTPRILKVLKKHKVKAVFCIPAYQLFDKRKLKIAKQAMADGHIMCNHSVTHPVFSKLSKKKQWWQIARAQQIFKNKLGIYPKFFRPPHGVITRTMKTVVRYYGMKMLLWDIDTKDWHPRTSSSKIYSRVISQWKKRRAKNKNSIVLFHDVNRKTTNVLERIIIRIKKGIHHEVRADFNRRRRKGSGKPKRNTRGQFYSRGAQSMFGFCLPGHDTCRRK